MNEEDYFVCTSTTHTIFMVVFISTIGIKKGNKTTQRRTTRRIFVCFEVSQAESLVCTRNFITVRESAVKIIITESHFKQKKSRRKIHKSKSNLLLKKKTKQKRNEQQHTRLFIHFTTTKYLLYCLFMGCMSVLCRVFCFFFGFDETIYTLARTDILTHTHTCKRCVLRADDSIFKCWSDFWSVISSSVSHNIWINQDDDDDKTA